MRQATGVELEAVDRTLKVARGGAIAFRSIIRTAVKQYPKRSVMCLALFVDQACIDNGVTFNLGTLTTKFFHVSTTIVPIFLLLYAEANLLGPLLFRRLFDTVGRVQMITARFFAFWRVVLSESARESPSTRNQTSKSRGGRSGRWSTRGEAALQQAPVRRGHIGQGG